MSGTRNKCKVCKHEKLDEINRRIRNNDTMASISRLYGISRDTLTKHKKQCIGALIASAKETKELLAGEVLLKGIQSDMAYIHKMLVACDKYLTDPDNPEEYFLGARGSEIDVVVNMIDEDGKVDNRQRKATLQELIDNVESSGRYLVVGLSSKHSDPRELLLKSATKIENTVKMLQDATQKQLENEFKNKAMKKLDGEDGVSLTVEQQVQTITNRVIIATKNSNSDDLSKIAGLPEIN